MHLFLGGQLGPIAPMIRAGENIEEQVRDKSKPAGSFRLSVYAWSASDTMQRALPPLALLHNTNIPMLVQHQEIEHGDALAVSLAFVVTHRRYNIRRVRDDENFNSQSLPFITWRLFRNFAGAAFACCPYTQVLQRLAVWTVVQRTFKRNRGTGGDWPVWLLFWSRIEEKEDLST